MSDPNASSAASVSRALKRSKIDSQSVTNLAVLEFIDTLDSDVDEVHSVMVLHHGEVIAEGWWAPYAPDRPHMLFSLSKSFCATGVGFAIAEGLLTLDDRIVDHFPADLPAEIGENLAAMRVRHLLTMTTGHAEDTLRHLWDISAANWVSAFLMQPVDFAPGTHFVYNSGASYMLSALVQKVTGLRLLDYLAPRLLDPLGIVGVTWEVSPQGVNTGGWGLSARTEDIAKFGQLYQNDGVWEGKRLLPEGWVAEATAYQVPNGDNPDSDWAQGYGYQFWRARHGAYRGDGAFGQFCVVLPEQDAIVAVTAGTKNMGSILNAIWQKLLPAFGPAPQPAGKFTAERLASRLAHLSLPRPLGRHTVPLAAEVSGVSYTLDEHAYSLRSFTARFENDSAVLEFVDRFGKQTIPCGLDGTWLETETTLETPGYPAGAGTRRAVTTTGAWIDDHTFVAKLCFVETPFSPTVSCQFVGRRLLLDFRVNAAFGSTDWPQMIGRPVKAG